MLNCLMQAILNFIITVKLVYFHIGYVFQDKSQLNDNVDRRESDLIEHSLICKNSSKCSDISQMCKL